ncbi:MAG: MOSC domain-containing protein [Opitutales bacterium]
MAIHLEAFFLSTGHDFKGRYGKPRGHHGIAEPQTIQCVAGKGLAGDRYFGHKPGFKGQATFVDRTAYQALVHWLETEHGRDPETIPGPAGLRRNILVGGLDLNPLIGQTFELATDGGSVRFSGSEACAPCFWMDAVFGPGTEAFLKGRGGLRVRILSDGQLSLGPAQIRVLDKNASSA